MVSLNLAREGWNNLKKILDEGVDGLKDVFTPSGDDIVRQITTPGNLSIVPSTPQIVTTVSQTIPVVAETSLTNLPPKPIYDGKVPNDYPDWQPEKQPEETPQILPDSVTDTVSKYGKYLKYVAIGGAALLAVSVLRK